MTAQNYSVKKSYHRNDNGILPPQKQLPNEDENSPAVKQASPYSSRKVLYLQNQIVQPYANSTAIKPTQSQ